MKKFLISVFILSLIGTPLSIIPFHSFQGESVSVAYAKSKKKKSKKNNKLSSKVAKQREKDTATRLKRLGYLGIPDSFYTVNGNLSLKEMGTIISAWIQYYYKQTGQIPNLLNEKTADWLVLNVGGKCVSSPKVCKRWEE